MKPSRAGLGGLGKAGHPLSSGFLWPPSREVRIAPDRHHHRPRRVEPRQAARPVAPRALALRVGVADAMGGTEEPLEQSETDSKRYETLRLYVLDQSSTDRQSDLNA